MKTKPTNHLFSHKQIAHFPRRLQASLEIDEVIAILKDGEWHNLQEVIKKSKLPEPTAERIIKFLAEYDFINFDNDHRKVKVAPSLLELLKETQI